MNEIEDIKKKVFRHPDSTDLYMKRVSKQVVNEFKELANSQFLGDYGVCLKWLIEGFKKKDQEVYAFLENHEERISNLEENKPNKPKKEIKMVNGSKKRIGGE
jgi:hypothetical protein